MKKLISTLIAAAMLTAGVGVFAETIHITDPETGEYELTYDEGEDYIGTVSVELKNYVDAHANDVIKRDKNLEESAADLVAEDILVGFPDGDYHENEYVTRAQMAVFMTRVSFGLNYSKLDREGIVRYAITTSEPFSEIPDEIVNEYAPEYPDLPEDHWAYTELMMSGVAEGYEDGTMRPDNNVTYLEAATMLVRRGGYATLIEEKGGYPDGVLYWADNMKLFERTNAEGNLDQPATRGDIIIMISTLLDSPVAGRFDKECRHSETIQQMPLTLRQYRDFRNVGETDPYIIVPAQTQSEE